MNSRVVIGAVGVAGAVIAIGQMNVGASSLDKAPSATKTQTDVVALGSSGPDVIVGDLHQFTNYFSDGLGHRTYSFGTTSCNIGTSNLAWISGTNQHPVIGQNLYRIAPQNGHARIEQLGQSWLKHGFFALSGSLCSGPGGCSGVPSGTALGVGCSDPYSATRNANQASAGAKFQVNAATGFFIYPPAHPVDTAETGNSSYGRLHVDQNEVLPSLNPGATYYAEGQYVHPQDSPEDGGAPNGASYRQVSMNASGDVSGFIGATVRKQPAISAWATVDPSVKSNIVQVDGYFYVAYAAWDNGDGTWDYEYAIENHNSDRSGGSFSVPIPAGVNVSNIGFRDVDYHSGEPYDNTDWVVSVGASTVTWSSPQTFAQNANSNALRWGTMYNFRFTADSPPTAAISTLGLFKPGSPTSVDISVYGPSDVAPSTCSADITGPGGLGSPDGNVDALDFLALIAQWGSPCVGSCEADITGPTPLTPDGNVDSLDFLLLVAQWGNPGNCP